MFDFQLSVPTEIHFGRDCELLAGKLMRPLAQRVLMIYGSDRIFRTELGGRLQESMEEAGCTVICLGGVKPNAETDWIEEARQLVLRENIEGILAVGGGSVIDSAKALAASAHFPGTVMELYENPEIQPEHCLPVGAVVTIPATASESNPMSVISDSVTHRKIAKPMPASQPRFALLNPALTLSVPAWQTASGGFDIFAHAFERYFDLRRESSLLDAMTEAVMKQVVDLLPKILAGIEDGVTEQNLQLRGDLMLAATVAHNDMLGPGGDFACHEISHVITEKFGVAHGAALAMIIPAWCRLMWKEAPERFERFFRVIWDADGETAEAVISDGITKMERFIDGIGLDRCIDTSASSEEERRQILGDIAAEAAGPAGRIGGGLAELHPDQIAEICKIFL